MNKPLPIIRDDSGKLIKNYTTYDWFNKLNEGLDEIKIAVWDFETNEYIDTYDEEDGSRYVGEKLQDFKIICTSMQTWLGYNEEMVNETAKKYIKTDNTLEYKISNEWIRALNVSLDQIKIDSFYDLSNSDEIIIDLLILIEICTAMQKRYCYLDDSECNKICEEVNEKNHNLREKETNNVDK